LSSAIAAATFFIHGALNGLSLDEYSRTESM